MLGRYSATAARSGTAIDLPYAHVWTVVDGTEFRQYTHIKAFRAAIS